MIRSKVFVEIRTSFIGFHAWPDAPEDVAFLRTRHRHVFHVRARKEVLFLNRSIEFFTLKNKITRYIHDHYPDGELYNLSCEMFALGLADVFDLAECEVSEDGENSGIVMIEKEIAL